MSEEWVEVNKNSIKEWKNLRFSEKQKSKNAYSSVQWSFLPSHQGNWFTLPIVLYTHAILRIACSHHETLCIRLCPLLLGISGHFYFKMTSSDWHTLPQLILKISIESSPHLPHDTTKQDCKLTRCQNLGGISINLRVMDYSIT